MALEFQSDQSSGVAANANATRNTANSFFHPGVKSAFLKEGTTARFRILPARDARLNKKDPAWLTSFVAHRDPTAGIEDPDVKGPAFTSWFQLVAGYTMVGNTKQTILSPKTIRYIRSISAQFSDADIFDPLDAFMGFLHRGAKTDPELKRIMEAKNGKSFIIPRFSTRALMNVITFDPKTGKPEGNAVLEMALGGLILIKKRMNNPPQPGVTPASPDWPMYVLGDPTHPRYGLLGFSETVTDNSRSTNTLSFASSDFTLQDSQPYPIDPNADWGRKFLTERYDLEDGKKVLKVWSGQEIADWAVNDGCVPYDLFARAVGNQVNLKAPRGGANPTHSISPTAGMGAGASADDHHADLEPAGGPPAIGQAPAASAQQAYTPPVQHQAVPGIEEKKFWASLPEGVVEKKESEIRALIAAGTNPATLQLINFDQSGGWETAVAKGFAPPPPPKPVAPPPPPAAATPPPPPPSAPTPPPAPANVPPAAPAPEAPAAAGGPPAIGVAPTAPSGPAAAAGGPPPAGMARPSPALGTPAAPAAGAAPAGNAAWTQADETAYQEVFKAITAGTADAATSDRYVELYARRSAAGVA